MSLSVHCFNNYKNQTTCPDLEVSYLIECKIPPEQNTVRIQRRNRKNNFSCAINAHVTVPTSSKTTNVPTSGKTTTINYVYLMIIFVLQQIWNKYTRVHFWPKYSYFRKKLHQCFWIQSMIDLIPVSTHIKRASIILVGWSGIESPTTLFYCYHQTTWFVCFVQFIFHQLLI